MISRGQKQEAGLANLRKKEKTNGLVGAIKKGAGQANLRKREKTNGFIGATTGGGAGQHKEKKENEWISRG